MIAELVTALCGDVLLTEEVDGLEVDKPHALQTAPGVCIHHDSQRWDLELQGREIAGLRYIGLSISEEWAVHQWLTPGRWVVAQPYVPPTRVVKPRAEKVNPVCLNPECPKCEAVVPGKVAGHPRASVTSRDGVPILYPSPVLKLAERARKAGWEVRQQYARGHGMHSGHGGVLAERDSYALIFSGHPLTDASAYAVYAGGGWKSVNIAGRMVSGVTALADWLERW